MSVILVFFEVLFLDLELKGTRTPVLVSIFG